jgi:hypothetical protein
MVDSDFYVTSLVENGTQLTQFNQQCGIGRAQTIITSAGSIAGESVQPRLTEATMKILWGLSARVIGREGKQHCVASGLSDNQSVHFDFDSLADHGHAGTFICGLGHD